jgi:lantibiotic modifying enzyme
MSEITLGVTGVAYGLLRLNCHVTSITSDFVS